jgi:hypothetical protein
MIENSGISERAHDPTVGRIKKERAQEVGKVVSCKIHT